MKMGKETVICSYSRMLHNGLYVNDPDMYVSTWVNLETIVREEKQTMLIEKKNKDQTEKKNSKVINPITQIQLY